MRRAVYDSMICLQFPSFIRWRVIAVDTLSGAVIDRMESVRFHWRRHADWWVRTHEGELVGHRMQYRIEATR
ncbi:MAG: hypothetical protein ABWY93_07960 [Mycobacterium sp.]